MKIGVIVCENCPQAGGEEAFANFYCKRFGSKSGDEWLPIYAVSGTLPDEQKIHDYDGFVITGSNSSANDNCKWIRDLSDFIRKVRKLNDGKAHKIKLFGICFGHQLIAKVFGGMVGLNPQRSIVLGAEDVILDEDFINKRFVRKSLGSKQRQVSIFEIHNEQVLKYPQDAKLVGWSKSSQCEILMYDDWIVSTQGHVEFTRDGLLPLFAKCMNISKEQEMLAVQRECHNNELIEMARNFFRMK